MTATPRSIEISTRVYLERGLAIHQGDPYGDAILLALSLERQLIKIIAAYDAHRANIGKGLVASMESGRALEIAVNEARPDLRPAEGDRS